MRGLSEGATENAVDCPGAHRQSVVSKIFRTFGLAEGCPTPPSQPGGQNRAALGYDLLQYFEKLYFSRLPFGHVRRVLALRHHVWLNASYKATVPLRLRLRKMFGRPPKRPPVLVTKSLGS
jgi:hypothetical protein